MLNYVRHRMMARLRFRTQQSICLLIFLFFATNVVDVALRWSRAGQVDTLAADHGEMQRALARAIARARAAEEALDAAKAKLSDHAHAEERTELKSASVDEAMGSAHAVDRFLRERLRNETRQCGRVYFDILASPVINRAVTHEECPDILGSIAAVGKLMPPLPAGATGSYFRPLTLPGCRLRWYTAGEACDVIERQGNLIFAGDSLVRGIVLALYAILTNNYVWGPVRGASGDIPPAFSQCQCDMVWGGDKICHQTDSMASSWAELAHTPQGAHICPNWGHAARLHYIPVGDESRKVTFERLISTSGTGRNTIYASEGFGWVPGHSARFIDPTERKDRLSLSQANGNFWHPLLNLTQKYDHTRVIVGTLLAKFGNYPTGSQSKESLAEYNDWLRNSVVGGPLGRSLGLELFDGRQLVEGLHSRDDVHYGSHDNVMLAQVLLNVLDKPPSVTRTAPAAVQRDPSLPYYHGTWKPDDGLWEPPFQREAGLLDWLGTDYDLRGCWCWSDWQARLKRNTSASVCYCRTWCPAEITPEWLTYAAKPGCDAQGWLSERDEGDPQGLCSFSCRKGGSNWGWKGARCGRDVHSSKLCTRPAHRCAPCNEQLIKEGKVAPGSVCHPLCKGDGTLQLQRGGG